MSREIKDLQEEKNDLAAGWIEADKTIAKLEAELLDKTQGMLERGKEIRELKAELAALREITRELADDVTAYVDADRPEELRSRYPHIMANFDRDMDVVKRAEALLAGGAVDPRRQIDYGPNEV